EIARWFSLAASHVPKLSPTAAEDLQQRVEAELGLSMSDDVQAAFGNTWTIYSAPSTGGALGVSPVISLDIRDQGRAEAVFAKAMDWLQRRIAASNSSSVSLQQEPFFDRSITTLSGWTPGGLALSPSFCLTDKHLLMAVQPQTLRAHLRFLTSRDETLADRTDCVVPVDARGFVLVDTPAILPTLWPIATMLGNSALNRLHSSGISADTGLIPSVSAILAGARPAFGVLRQTDTALVAEMRHPLSGMAPALTAAAVVALSHDQARHPAPDASPVMESPSIDLGSPSTETSSSDEPASALNAIVEPGKAEPIPTVLPPTPRRVWLSGLIRAVTPDDVEATLPPTVFDRIERGPPPEELQRREERRKARDARKKSVPR
ncbi:MAG TPA: hypothetical protein VFG20_08900, partial [Planctomycetaceae bacterium]|nr:hypothetical protein [Planctomycetaceae bacterium]